jgi:hypothetical protein
MREPSRAKLASARKWCEWNESWRVGGARRSAIKVLDRAIFPQHVGVIQFLQYADEVSA